MRPKAKYAVIYRYRDEYPVSVMCKFFGVSRSGYYDFVKRFGKPSFTGIAAFRGANRDESWNACQCRISDCGDDSDAFYHPVF